LGAGGYEHRSIAILLTIDRMAGKAPEFETVLRGSIETFNAVYEARSV